MSPLLFPRRLQKRLEKDSMILTIQILKFRRNKAYLVGVLYLVIIANFQGHMMLSMELCLYQAVVTEERKIKNVGQESVNFSGLDQSVGHAVFCWSYSTLPLQRDRSR